MNHKSTSCLGKDQLARLFELGQENDLTDVISGEDKVNLLWEILEWASVHNEQISTLPDRMIQRAVDWSGLPSVMNEQGCPLLNSKARLFLFERIKKQAKGLVKSTQKKAEREVATVVYYGAIAAALIVHRQKITQSSYDKLNAAFRQLRAMNWLPSDMVHLFMNASEFCEAQIQDESPYHKVNDVRE